MYYSDYDAAYLDALAGRLRALGRTATDVWCIFDNTASGAAAGTAVSLLERLAGEPAVPAAKPRRR